MIRGRLTLDDIVRERSVFVLGSAPNASLDHYSSDDLLVTVNGSMAPFQHIKPDIHFINGYTLGESNPVADASKDALSGRHVKHLVCISRLISYEAILKKLADINLTYETSEEMTGKERADLVSRFTGSPARTQGGSDVASTGVSAILALREAGASWITISGFSLQEGHSYLTEKYPRQHTRIDSLVLREYI